MNYNKNNMKLSQYRIIRTRKFPIKFSTKPKHPPHNITTYALLSPYIPQTYQIHINNNSQNQTGIIMFNDYQYLKIGFNYVFKVQHSNDEEIIRKIVQQISATVSQHDNNLIICNAIQMKLISNLIYPIPTSISPTNPTQTNILKSIVNNLLTTKQKHTVITISIIGIKANGALEDQFNYGWVNESQYIEDLLMIKKKLELKVRKYRNQIKVCELNRQQINSWEECQEIIGNSLEIKDYIDIWNKQLNKTMVPIIGQLYQLCEIQIQDSQGYIKSIHRRNCLLKFNQYLKQSNSIMIKLAKEIRNKIKDENTSYGREEPIIMFLKNFFGKDSNSYFSVVGELGYGETIKQECKYLGMNVTIDDSYTYLKNYRDKPQIISQIKSFSTIYTPLTTQQRSQLKLTSFRNLSHRVRARTIQIIRESEVVRSKSFSFETISSREKKVGGKSEKKMGEKEKEKEMVRKCRSRLGKEGGWDLGERNNRVRFNQHAF